MTAPITADVTTAVARGVERLDQAGPADWRQRLDLTRLDIANANDCVLGQLYSSYGVGLYTLRLSFGDASRYGFSCPAWARRAPCACPQLRQAWIQAVTPPAPLPERFTQTHWSEPLDAGVRAATD